MEEAEYQFKHRLRGVAQVAYESEDDEGLDDNSFQATKYLAPDASQSFRRYRDSLFDAGEAPLCGTNLVDLSSMGVGIGLYFRLLKYLALVMLLCGVVMLPTMLVYSYSSFIPGEEKDPISISALTLGNFGEVNGNSSTSIVIPGTGVSVSLDTAASIISWSDVGVTLILIGFLIWWKVRVGFFARLFDENNITMADYSIYVKGFPKDITEDQIREHFDRLYNLRNRDWTYRGSRCCLLGRKVRQRRQYLGPLASKAARERAIAIRKRGIRVPMPPRDNHVAPVLDATNTGNPSYLRSWVAEVAIVHPNGVLVRKYRQLLSMLRTLRAARARVKKFTLGLSDTPDEKKRQKAARKLQKLEKDMLRRDMEYAGQYRDDCVGAFVVFNNEESLRRCLYDYQGSTNWFRRLFQAKPLQYKQMPKASQFGAPEPKYHRLQVRQAPEPGDVLWENLEVTPWQRFWRRSSVNFLLLVILLVSFGFLFWAQERKEAYAQNLPNYGLCDRELPAVSYGTYDFPSDLYLARKPALEKSSCNGDDRYLVWESSSSLPPSVNTTANPCLAPCVPASGGLTCHDLRGVAYRQSLTLGCYCLQKLNEAIDREGVLLGAATIATDSDTTCVELARDYIVSQILVLVAAVSVVVINTLLNIVLQAVTKLERYDSISQEKAAMAIKIFLAQFLNTGLIILLVNLAMPFGPISLGQLNLFNGRFHALKSSWYAIVGASICFTLIINVFAPHLMALVRALCWRGCRRGRGYGAVTQAQMDHYFKAEEFNIETRYPLILNTFLVSLLYASGIPLLYFLASGFFIVSYWVDKYMILRVFRRPPLLDNSLAKLALRLMPFALIAHCVMAIFMYGDQEALPNKAVFFGSRGGVNADEAFKSFLEAVKPYDPLGFAQRSVKSHVFPMFALLMLILVAIIVYLAMGQTVLRCFIKVFRKAFRCVCALDTLHMGNNQMLPRFTSKYEHKLPTGNKYMLTNEEILDGWRIIPDKSRGKGAESKIKVWTEDSVVNGKEHYAGQRMLTWEVIAEYAIASYDMMANPQYFKAIEALEDGRAKTLAALQARRAEARARGLQAQVNSQEDESMWSSDDESVYAKVSQEKQISPTISYLQSPFGTDPSIPFSGNRVAPDLTDASASGQSSIPLGNGWEEEEPHDLVEEPLFSQKEDNKIESCTGHRIGWEKQQSTSSIPNTGQRRISSFDSTDSDTGAVFMMDKSTLLNPAKGLATRLSSDSSVRELLCSNDQAGNEVYRGASGSGSFTQQFMPKSNHGQVHSEMNLGDERDPNTFAAHCQTNNESYGERPSRRLIEEMGLTAGTKQSQQPSHKAQPTRRASTPKRSRLHSFSRSSQVQPISDGDINFLSVGPLSTSKRNSTNERRGNDQIQPEENSASARDLPTVANAWVDDSHSGSATSRTSQDVMHVRSVNVHSKRQ